ncbi:hypothetical protein SARGENTSHORTY9_42 [Mycobacterium phage SargentShorty9]|nr:hypothetical protein SARGENTSHORTY9_42 [Mycobacterium phage SargentShorty9]
MYPTCRYCKNKISYIEVRAGFRWVAHLGSSICYSDKSPDMLHHPEIPSSVHADGRNPTTE